MKRLLTNLLLILMAFPLVSRAQGQTARRKEETNESRGQEQNTPPAPAAADSTSEEEADSEETEQAETEEPQPQLPYGLQFAGDFRLRFENTTNQALVPATGIFEDPRNRSVIRFRAGITKDFTDYLKFGARLATGSSDDPNTTDVTLGSFINDLEFSLDQVYLQLHHQGVVVSGGKFPNPFLTSTDMVWDGDVNPQGVAGSFAFGAFEDRMTTKLTGAFTIVDEQTTNPDSTMWGTQLDVGVAPAPEWSFRLAGAFYDYEIINLTNADAGDTRSNLLNAEGTAYLSDFNLLNAVAFLDLRKLGERYPVRVVGDYVINLGAATSEDQGYSVDIFVGRAANRNDRRFRYGFSRAETDSVIAAFSHDNTTIPTNYEQHTVTFDYVPIDNLVVNATWYLYRQARAVDPDDNPFISRLRLNVLVNF